MGNNSSMQNSSNDEHIDIIHTMKRGERIEFLAIAYIRINYNEQCTNSESLLTYIPTDIARLVQNYIGYDCNLIIHSKTELKIRKENMDRMDGEFNREKKEKEEAISKLNQEVGEFFTNINSLKNSTKIAVCGSWQAGTTTILNYLDIGEPTHYISSDNDPTGLNNFALTRIISKNKRVQILSWDHPSNRLYQWLSSLRKHGINHSFPNIDALIYVFDSWNREIIYKQQIKQTKMLLNRLLKEEAFKECLLLIYANKQDLIKDEQKNVLSVETIKTKLELNEIKDHEWHIQSSCAIKPVHGIHEGLDWIGNELNDKAFKETFNGNDCLIM